MFVSHEAFSHYSSAACRHIYQHFRSEKSKGSHNTSHKQAISFTNVVQMTSSSKQEKLQFVLLWKYHWQSVALPDIDLIWNSAVFFQEKRKEGNELWHIKKISAF